MASSFRCFVDEFDSKGSYSVLCKTRVKKSLSRPTVLISLCMEVKHQKEQILNITLLFYSVFLPRLIYNAEAWSSLTEVNIPCLQKARLHYLRRILEVQKSTHTAAFYLRLPFNMKLKEAIASFMYVGKEC